MINKKHFSRTRYLLAQLNPFSATVLAVEDTTRLKFHAYKRDVIGRELFKTGGHDIAFTRWLVQRYKGIGGNFVDVGANLGYFSCIFGDLARDKGKVLAIEPEPDNLYLLRKNIAINRLDNLIVAPVAVGASEGEAKLNIYKGSNRGRHSITPIQTENSILVPVKPLDDLVATAFLPEERINFIKIDVEGYESNVIKGAAVTLQRTDMVLVEYAPYLLKSAGEEAFDFIHILFKQFPKTYESSQDGFKPITLNQCLERQDSLDLVFEK